jgi:hypothetical protein
MTEKVVTPDGAETGHPIAGDKVIEGSKPYTEANAYKAGFYLLGNFHYKPEDDEHAKNPLFRLIREWQLVLRAEQDVQKIFAKEVTDKVAAGTPVDHEEMDRYVKALCRVVSLEVACKALDDYYEGRELSPIGDVIKLMNS